MKTLREPTFWARIYISGPLNVIEQVCRDFFMNDTECCATVDPTKFIYTGGEQTGAVIQLINYPRFPSTPAVVQATAERLAKKLLIATHQIAALVMTPHETIYYSLKE